MNHKRKYKYIIMSSVKGVVNRNAKTSGKNSATNTALQNADTKDAVQNKTHEKEKLQVPKFNL